MRRTRGVAGDGGVPSGTGASLQCPFCCTGANSFVRGEVKEGN